MRFRTLLWRAVRLRCTLCGKGRMFDGYWKVRESCSHCGQDFAREQGFFLGSIYFNYGLTAVIVAVAYPLLLFNEVVPERTLLWSSLLFTVLFPVWFFRYARALWAGFDQYWDPREGELAGESAGRQDGPDEHHAKPRAREPASSDDSD